MKKTWIESDGESINKKYLMLFGIADISSNGTIELVIIL